MGKPEGRIERALVTRVLTLGGQCRKVGWIARRGAPDRYCLVPRAYRTHIAKQLGLAGWSERNPWVECKAPGQPLDEHQSREIERLRAYGETVLVIDTLEAIDRFFPLVLKGH